MEELWTRALTDLVELLEKWIEVVPPYLVDLFNRYAMFGIFKEWILSLLCLIWVIASIYWWYRMRKYCDEDIDCLWWIIIILWIPLVLCTVWLFVCWADLLEAIFLPEIYVIHDLQWCTSCR